MGKYFNCEAVEYGKGDAGNLLSFSHYDAAKVIGDKTMKDHLRFALSYWHTMTGSGADPFGSGNMERPWEQGLSEMDLAKMRADVAFELMDILGIDYFCFHDVDVAPDSDDLKEKISNLRTMAEYLQGKMADSGKKLLWGTTNAFSHPRFVHGASTSCNADVFSFAAAQVKHAMEVTHELGGENYVFWGGREGYETLLNTDLKLELDNLARFLTLAVEHKEKIGFKGQLLIEPKPKEPTKHQYDFDTATVIGFLTQYGLQDHFKINVEVNHATLAGHTFEHELRTARINGMLGSIDANQGDMLLGWDTDQFPSDVYTATLGMYEMLKQGGIAPGGLNFDAKVRRGSMKPEDILYAYILGMDTYAKGLDVASRLLADGVIEDFVANRYRSYQQGIGQKIVSGETSLDELADYAMRTEIVNESGGQEQLEMIVNRYLFG